jgi:hypothetical protein
MDPRPIEHMTICNPRPEVAEAPRTIPSRNLSIPKSLLYDVFIVTATDQFSDDIDPRTLGLLPKLFIIEQLRINTVDHIDGIN